MDCCLIFTSYCKLIRLYFMTVYIKKFVFLLNITSHLKLHLI